jgi:hypothetical protein
MIRLRTVGPTGQNALQRLALDANLPIAKAESPAENLHGKDVFQDYLTAIDPSGLKVIIDSPHVGPVRENGRSVGLPSNILILVGDQLIKGERRPVLMKMFIANREQFVEFGQFARSVTYRRWPVRSCCG